MYAQSHHGEIKALSSPRSIFRQIFAPYDLLWLDDMYVKSGLAREISFCFALCFPSSKNDTGMYVRRSTSKDVVVGMNDSVLLRTILFLSAERLLRRGGQQKDPSSTIMGNLCITYPLLCSLVYPLCVR